MRDVICSIIIAARNEESYIERCIESLENQSYDRRKYEIIVVEGMSEDNTFKIVEVLKSKYNNIILLRNSRKIAPVAFNTGIKESAGRYVFIVGAHAEYPSDFIEKSISGIKENNVDCVGGRIINIGRSKLGKVFSTVRNTAFGGGLSPYRYSDKKRFVNTVAFGCYSRDILDRVGGFNEDFVRNHDNDLNKRIIQAGGKILFEPEIKFYYFTRNSLKDILRQMFSYGFWEAKLIKKHKEQLAITTLIPMLFVLYTIFAVAILIFRRTIIPLLLELVPYLTVFAYFAIKAVVSKKQSIIVALFLYILIHFCIGIGFISGLMDINNIRQR